MFIVLPQRTIEIQVNSGAKQFGKLAQLEKEIDKLS